MNIEGEIPECGIQFMVFGLLPRYELHKVSFQIAVGPTAQIATGHSYAALKTDNLTLNRDQDPWSFPCVGYDRMWIHRDGVVILQVCGVPGATFEGTWKEA